MRLGARSSLLKPLALAIVLLIIAFAPASEAKKRPTEPCTVDGDCGSNKCVGGSCAWSGYSGTCEDNGDCLSNSCDGPSSSCNPSHAGQRCQYGSDCYTNLCGPDLICKPSTTGGPCNGGIDCGSGVCDGTFRCSANPSGGPCLVGTDCINGKCDGVCALGALGDPCNNDLECAYEFYCKDSTKKCANKLPKSQPCDTGRHRMCISNVCDASTGRCAASALGVECFTTADCGPGVECISGICHVPGGTLPTYSNVLGNWLLPTGAALLVSFLVVALAYMIGFGFRYHTLEQWAKAEFWEASLSAAIAGTVFFFAQLLSDISFILVGQNHFQEAQVYVSGIFSHLMGTWGSMLVTMEAFGVLSSLSIMFFIPIGLPSPIPLPYPATYFYLRTGTSVALFAGWGAVMQGLAAPMYLLYFALLSNSAQSMLLHFSQYDMLSAFLPLGILFRAFPLTRKMGGTVIAMALALYFVFPLSLALNRPILDLYSGFGAASITGSNQWSSDFFGLFKLPAGTLEVFMPALRSMFLWIVLSVFLFLFDIIITITAFRAIAEAVGGDPQIFGMGKLGI